jgi:hypothetical protein
MWRAYQQDKESGAAVELSEKSRYRLPDNQHQAQNESLGGLSHAIAAKISLPALQLLLERDNTIRSAASMSSLFWKT